VGGGGCSSPSAVTAGSETSCYQFAARAIQRHVTVTAVPAACQGMSTRNRRGGPQPRHGPGPGLNFAHFGLALTGLPVWISYLATGITALAWAACGFLLAAASLGITLAFLGPASTATAIGPADDPPPAGHPPVFVIAAHVTAACITILLATLAAIGAG
jgi:manganese efflux pump family protein